MNGQWGRGVRWTSPEKARVLTGKRKEGTAKIHIVHHTLQFSTLEPKNRTHSHENKTCPNVPIQSECPNPSIGYEFYCPVVKTVLLTTTDANPRFLEGVGFIFERTVGRSVRRCPGDEPGSPAGQQNITLLWRDFGCWIRQRANKTLIEFRLSMLSVQVCPGLGRLIISKSFRRASPTFSLLASAQDG